MRTGATKTLQLEVHGTKLLKIEVSSCNLLNTGRKWVKQNLGSYQHLLIFRG